MPSPIFKKEYLVVLTSLECKNFFDYTNEPGFSFTPDGLQVAYSLTLIVKSGDKIDIQVGMRMGENGKDYSEISLVHHFNVTPLSAIMSINEATHEISFDESLLLTLLPQAFSTTRGYFSAKLEGTPLHDYPFPVIRTQELVSSCRMMVEG